MVPMQHQHENVVPGNVAVRDKTRKVPSVLEQHSKKLKTCKTGKMEKSKKVIW